MTFRSVVRPVWLTWRKPEASPLESHTEFHHQQGNGQLQSAWQTQSLKSLGWQESEWKINSSRNLVTVSFVGWHLKIIGCCRAYFGLTLRENALIAALYLQLSSFMSTENSIFHLHNFWRFGSVPGWQLFQQREVFSLTQQTYFIAWKIALH